MKYIKHIDIPILVEEDIKDIVSDCKKDKLGPGFESLVLNLLPYILKTARKITTKFNSNSIESHDLVVAGIEGLKNAIDKFSPKKSVLFLTFASYDIRHRMTQELSKNLHVIKIPIKKIKDPKVNVNIMPLDLELFNKNKELKVNADPYSICVHREKKSIDRKNISKALKSLSKRSRDIILDRFWSNMNYEEIAIKYSITRQATRQSTERSLKSLRTFIKNR